MEFKKVTKREEKYYLNDDQFFLIDKENIRKKMAEWPFPMIIMDTEFFNKSHDKNHLKPSVYNHDYPDMVYTLSYSIARSYKDLLNRNNDRAITSYSIYRRNGDKHFDFQKEMDKMLGRFFHVAIRKKVRCLVFAGKQNDEKILNNWINRHTNFFANKITDLFIKEQTTHQWKLQVFDIYPILENGISVNDAIDKETKYDVDDNLKKGMIGDNTKQIPSLKRFFDYVNLFPNITQLTENDDIYNLCVDILKIFTLPGTERQKINHYQRSLSLAIRHCKNDVIKLLYLIYFLHCFACLDDQDNPFVKNKAL